MLAGIVKSTGRLRNLASALSRRTSSKLDCQTEVDRACAPNIYGGQVPWEIPVQLCLGDLLRHGDCALDVGANIGGVAIAMSRMVGLSGTVHAFEANPKTLARLRIDLAANNAGNVTVVPKAAWSSSGKSISFYCDNSYYAAASSVHRRDESWQEVRVPTVSLDDYCRANRLIPKAIKLDVEGAEFDVLQGARSVLDRHSPSLVMEYYPPEDAHKDPLELLRSLGFIIYDTNLYRQVDRKFYLNTFATPPLVNVLAISPAAEACARYGKLSLKDLGASFPHPDGAGAGAIRLREPGRYIVIADLEGPTDAMAALQVTDSDGKQLAYFQAPLEHLKQHACSNVIVEVDQPTDIDCTVSSADSPDVRIREIRITQVKFSGAP